MGTTATFVKSRSSGTPKVGEWNIDYAKALSLAKKDYKFIVTMWSNGDKCGYCTAAEKCMMDKAFTDWMKKSDAYFVFQYSGDKDAGKTLYDLIYKAKKLKYYPGLRIMLFNNGKAVVDTYIDGNTLRGSKSGTTGAKTMVENLKKIFAQKPVQPEPAPEPTPVVEPCVVRLNEKLTVAQINKVLDALDRNDGYCPCQPKAEGTKCHCEDFTKNKKIGEPCICKIFVKQKLVALKAKRKAKK